MSAPAIGIDLGTTYSAVAVFRNGNAEIIANDQGNRTTPSIVAFTSSQRLVGEAAMYQAAENPENTVYGVKRLMGRSFDDAVIQPDIRAWPFKVLQDNNRIKIDTQFKGQRKRFSPEEISAEVLQKMKETAETFLGVRIKDVVITCPAYFNNGQREATKEAANIAGLNVLRMINEPTAAAMAYGLSVNNVGRKNVLIFDFGGGTFDVSILTIKDKDYKVRATNGDTHLGGEDFDHRMVDYFVADFKRKNGRDISLDKSLMRSLKNHCERAKRILSFSAKAEFALEGTNLTGTITRARFEDMCYDLFEKAINLIDATLKDAELSKREIDEVVLVGGSSRIPKIQEMLSDFFNGKSLNKRVNPDEAVALGAAIQAGMLQNNLSDQLKGLKLCDVCPLSMGSVIADGSVTVAIKRNTPIPTKASQTFTTFTDFQTSADIRIYEGERVMAKDNHFLGRFVISGIPPLRRGEAKMENIYEINSDGILTVTAFVPLSGSKKSLTITKTSHMNHHDAKRVIDDAKKAQEEDAAHKERLKAFNALDNYVYDIKRKIEEMKEGQFKQKAESMIAPYASILLKNRYAPKHLLEQKKYELTNAWHHIKNEYEEYEAQKKEARKYDAVQKERVKAFNALEKYVYDIKDEIEEMQRGPIKHKAKSIIGQYASFLSKNPDAPKHLLQQKKYELTEAWHRVKDEYDKERDYNSYVYQYFF